MKQLKLQLNRLNVVQIAVFLLIFGLFIGILCANVFRANFSERLMQYESSVFAEIVDNDINYPGLFRYVLGNNFSDFIMFWLLCVTILGIPYIALRIISFGFFAGFFISAVTMQYGVKGLVLVLVYCFPHGLLYLPIMIIGMYKGFIMCRDIFQSEHTSFGSILRLIRANVITILILAIALVFASFLEAYPGAYFLKKALALFVE